MNIKLLIDDKEIELSEESVKGIKEQLGLVDSVYRQVSRW